MYASAIRAGLFVLGCATAFWLGDRVASGRYEARLADVSEAIAESQNAAVERHNLELETERKRASASASARSELRQVAQGVIHEVASDADLSCEWRDAHRMRLESVYAAYGYAADDVRGVEFNHANSANIGWLGITSPGRSHNHRAGLCSPLPRAPLPPPTPPEPGQGAVGCRTEPGTPGEDPSAA